jgi:hypothetical protein
LTGVESLGWKQLNRAVLARQLLLERSRLPLYRVVERMAGVQAQYIPSAYVGVWSRTEGFTRDTLTGALQRGSVIQGTLMRGTIHLVSRADYWPIAAAIRDLMRQWWLRVDRSGRSAEDMEELAGRLRFVLADGPKRRAELVDELGIDNTAWNGVGYWVELVRVPPSGTWESRRADLYGLATEWVGPDGADASSGAEHLVRRYLAGFGPASREDIKSFTGFGLAEVDQILVRLPGRRFADENGGMLVDVSGAPLPDPGAPAPVRFLGTWDASLLVHSRRAQILPEEYRGRIFHTRAPHSFNTFLVDGQVAGTWREEGGEIRLEPFHPIPSRFRRELEQESERLAALFD